MRTIETIKTGKMQYNVKSGKDFRAAMAKWHDADFDLAEKIMEKNDRVKNYRNMVNSNQADLDKLEKGETGVLRDKATIEAEIADFNARIDAENKALAEYKKAQADRYESAHALLSKDLYNAYVDFQNNGNRDAYVIALANFFDANGLEPAIDSLNEFVAAVGKKKNSARQKIKDQKHNGVFSYNAWRDIFLGEVCDVMGDALPMHKFHYVLKENRKDA